MKWLDNLINCINPQNFEVIPFKEEVEGNSISAYLYIPKPLKNWNGQAIVILHGAFHLAGYKDYEDAKAYANMGFGILLLKYDNEKSIDLVKDRKEVLDAVKRFREKYPQIKKLNLMGVSRGGFVAFHVWLVASGLFDKAAILVAPAHLPSMRESLVKNGLWKHIEPYWSYFHFPGDEETSSPVHYIPAMREGSLMVFYGLKDNTVPADQGERLAKAWGLVKGKNFLTFNYGHGLAREKDVQEIIRAFFLK